MDRAKEYEKQLQSLRDQVAKAQGEASAEAGSLPEEINKLLESLEKAERRRREEAAQEQEQLRLERRALDKEKAKLARDRSGRIPIFDVTREPADPLNHLQGDDQYHWSAMSSTIGNPFRSQLPAWAQTKVTFHPPSNQEEPNPQEVDDSTQDATTGLAGLTAEDKIDALTQALTKTFLHKNESRSSLKEHESAKLSDTNPENWLTFKDNFLTTAALNEWKGERAKLKLKAAMRDEAAKAVQHIRFPPSWTLQQALAAYEEVFVHPAGVELAQAELEKARKKSDETLLTFHTRLRYLFLRAYPNENPETSKKLKDLFATQLGSLAMSKELRTSPSYRQESYTLLLTRAQDVEATFKTLQEAYRGNRGVNAIQLYEDDEEEDMDLPGINALAGANGSRRHSGPSSGPPRCHACDSEDHKVRQCPYGKKLLEAIRAHPERFGYVPNNSSSKRGQSSRRGSSKANNSNSSKPAASGN